MTTFELVKWWVVKIQNLLIREQKSYWLIDEFCQRSNILPHSSLCWFQAFNSLCWSWPTVLSNDYPNSNSYKEFWEMFCVTECYRLDVWPQTWDWRSAKPSDLFKPDDLFGAYPAFSQCQLGEAPALSGRRWMKINDPDWNSCPSRAKLHSLDSCSLLCWPWCNMWYWALRLLLWMKTTSGLAQALDLESDSAKNKRICCSETDSGALSVLYLSWKRGDDLFSYSGFPFHPHTWSRFCLYFFLCFEQPPAPLPL